MHYYIELVKRPISRASVNISTFSRLSWQYYLLANLPYMCIYMYMREHLLAYIYK